MKAPENCQCIASIYVYGEVTIKYILSVNMCFCHFLASGSPSHEPRSCSPVGLPHIPPQTAWDSISLVRALGFKFLYKRIFVPRHGYGRRQTIAVFDEFSLRICASSLQLAGMHIQASPASCVAQGTSLHITQSSEGMPKNRPPDFLL